MARIVVTHPFNHFLVGQEIDDPALVAAIMGSSHSHFVVRIADEPVAPPTPNALSFFAQQFFPLLLS